MEGHKTVRINNRLYDAATGMPLDEFNATTPEEVTTDAKTPEPTATVEHPKKAPAKAATEVHTTQQRSQTLHRRATKKPGPTPRPQPGRHMDIARSPSVNRFAKTIEPITAAPKKPEVPDAPATTHPTVKRALAAVARPQQVITATPRQIKDAAIQAALAPTVKTKAEKQPRNPADTNRFFTKRYLIISAIAVALIAIAAIVYANLPVISVSVASAQAGITASYPKYVPDGYTLSQPVSFKEREVALTFKSNSGAGEYTVRQAASSWNSTAVLDNVVRKAAGENYVTNQESGLTIYSYDGNAAWVNAGILYTIESSAPLASDQIRRIATSL
jgi:cell wall-associated NlpC family hydrolase